MGELLYIFIGLIVLAVIFSVLMIVWKTGKKSNIAFILGFILSLIITFLNVTSGPSNNVSRTCLAWITGLPAVIGLVLRLMKKGKNLLPQILVIVSIVVGFLEGFFFI